MTEMPGIDDRMALIGQEHCEIDRMIKAIGGTAQSDEAKLTALSMVGALIDLSAAHTAGEEELMILYKYDRYDEHVADHSEIFSEMAIILADLERLTSVDWGRFALRFHEIYKSHRIAFDEPFFEFLKGCF